MPNRATSSQPNRREREVTLEGAFNVRDLGGLPVGPTTCTKPGLVFRADSLESLTDRDIELLFGTLKIGTILDLRTPEEAGGDGLADARRFPTLAVHSFPVIPDGRIGVEPFPAGDPEAVAKHYLDYVVDRAPIVAGAITTIAESVALGVPVLFHCAAGRDRTGVVAAVLLGLLEVPDEHIVSDYADSNWRAEDVSRRLTLNPLYRPMDERAEGGLTKVDPAAIRLFLELFETQFGSPRAWAERSGITEATLAGLARHLVRHCRPASWDPAR